MTFIVFILGIVVGMGLALLTLIAAVFIEGSGGVTAITNSKWVKTNPKGSQRAVVFDPKSDVQQRQNEIIKENAKKGQPTPLEDL